MIDWKLAAATAARIAPQGPEVSGAEAAEHVEALRAAAAAAVDPVREVTGLVAADTPVNVIDRKRWAEANVATFERLSAPFIDKLAPTLTPVATRVGPKVAAVELGAMLGYLSSRVLGQFDPFAEPEGRLLLVAPNVLRIGKVLDVDLDDFRLWVCLHEQTHRAQFTAVDWLAGHFESLVAKLGSVSAPQHLSFSAIIDNLPQIVSIIRGDSTASLAEVFQNAEQAAILDEITALMSLLEGHADVMMDEVGPQIVPSVGTIRQRFNSRRTSTGLALIIRRLTGMEAKMRQYSDGSAFVRRATKLVGPEGFSAVWASPENLPRRAELADAAAWVDRVHG